MKPIQTAVVIAGLSLLTFKTEAQSSFDFQYGYEDVYSPNALNYIVQQQNIERSAEGNPADGISYWNPINNGTPAILTQEFMFSGPTTEIFLNARLASFNFGGSEFGSGSLLASKDGVNWVLLENAPTQGVPQANYIYKRPDRVDERAFYMNVVMNSLGRDGFEFAGMSNDQNIIVMKRPFRQSSR